MEVQETKAPYTDAERPTSLNISLPWNFLPDPENHCFDIKFSFLGDKEDVEKDKEGLLPPDSASLKAEMESLRDFIIANVTQLQRRVSILEKRVDDAGRATSANVDADEISTSSAGDAVDKPAPDRDDATRGRSESSSSSSSSPNASSQRADVAPLGNGDQIPRSSGDKQQRWRRPSPPQQPLMVTRSGGKGKEPLSRSNVLSSVATHKVSESRSVALDTETGHSPVDRRNRIATILRNSGSRRSRSRDLKRNDNFPVPHTRSETGGIDDASCESFNNQDSLLMPSLGRSPSRANNADSELTSCGEDEDNEDDDDDDDNNNNNNSDVTDVTEMVGSEENVADGVARTVSEAASTTLSRKTRVVVPEERFRRSSDSPSQNGNHSDKLEISTRSSTASTTIDPSHPHRAFSPHNNDDDEDQITSFHSSVGARHSLDSAIVITGVSTFVTSTIATAAATRTSTTTSVTVEQRNDRPHHRVASLGARKICYASFKPLRVTSVNGEADDDDDASRVAPAILGSNSQSPGDADDRCPSTTDSAVDVSSNDFTLPVHVLTGKTTAGKSTLIPSPPVSLRTTPSPNADIAEAQMELPHLPPTPSPTSSLSILKSSHPDHSHSPPGMLSEIPSLVAPVNGATASGSSSTKRTVEVAGFVSDQSIGVDFSSTEEWSMERRLSLDGVSKLDFLASLYLRPATTAPDNRRSKRLKRMEENKSRSVPFPTVWKESKPSSATSSPIKPPVVKCEENSSSSRLNQSSPPVPSSSPPQSSSFPTNSDSLASENNRVAPSSAASLPQPTQRRQCRRRTSIIEPMQNKRKFSESRAPWNEAASSAVPEGEEAAPAAAAAAAGSLEGNSAASFSLKRRSSAVDGRSETAQQQKPALKEFGAASSSSSDARPAAASASPQPNAALTLDGRNSKATFDKWSPELTAFFKTTQASSKKNFCSLCQAQYLYEHGFREHLSKIHAMEGGMSNRLSMNAIRQLERYQKRVRQIQLNQINKDKVSRLVGVAKRKALMSQPAQLPKPAPSKNTNKETPSAAIGASKSKRSKAKTDAGGGGGDGGAAVEGIVQRAVDDKRSNELKKPEGTTSPTVKTSPRTAKPTTKVIEMRKMNAKRKGGGLSRGKLVTNGRTKSATNKKSTTAGSMVGPEEKPGRGQPGYAKHFRRCRICLKFFGSYKMVSVHKKLVHGVDDSVVRPANGQEGTEKA